MSDEIEQSIRENAQQPAKAAGDSGSVEQLAVGNGGTVLVVHVTRGELGGSLGARSGPDTHGGDGDDGIHRESLPSGDGDPLPSVGRGADVDVGRIPRNGASGAGSSR